MRKPKIVRLFQRRKKKGHGLDNVRATRKEEEERDELRNKGLDSINVHAMKPTNVVSLDDMDREEPLEIDSSRRGRKARKKGEPSLRVGTRAIREDYSENTDDVAAVLRNQDDDLDKIGDALTDMRALASAMNTELEYQDKLIVQVQDYTTETSRRTKENAKKVAQIR